MLTDPSMLNQVQRSIYDTIVHETVNKSFVATTGFVTAIDPVKWTANIESSDPVSGAKIWHLDVPMPLDQHGLKTRPLEPGDIVFLAFGNAKFNAPYILCAVPYQPNTPAIVYCAPDILTAME